MLTTSSNMTPKASSFLVAVPFRESLADSGSPHQVRSDGPRTSLVETSWPYSYWDSRSRILIPIETPVGAAGVGGKVGRSNDPADSPAEKHPEKMVTADYKAYRLAVARE